MPIDSFGNAFVDAWPNYGYNTGIEKTSRRYLNVGNVYHVEGNAANSCAILEILLTGVHVKQEFPINRRRGQGREARTQLMHRIPSIRHSN